MSDFTKVKIAYLLYSSRFWVATIVYYFTTQGLTLEQAFWLIGFHYVLSLLLEFPTGVIGDYYSHKRSVIVGYLVLGSGFLLLSFPGSVAYYFLATAVISLGTAFISGSDTALVHAVSEAFQKQYANLSALSVVVTALALAVGSALAAIDLRYPLYVTAVFLFVGALTLTSLKNYRYERSEASILAVARSGLRFIRKQPGLLPTILLIALTSGLFFDYKWLYNPIFEAAALPVAWWGTVAGIAVLAVALGSKLVAHASRVPLFLVLSGLTLGVALTGATFSLILIVAGLLLSHFLRGYLETTLMVRVNEVITGSIRSSVLSASSVGTRLMAALYMGIAAIVMGQISIGIFLISTAVAVFAIGACLIGRMNTMKYA